MRAQYYSSQKVVTMPSTDTPAVKTTAQETFETELSALIAKTDFNGFGKIAEHDKSKPGEPTHYYSYVANINGGDGMVIAGEKVYPSRIQVSVNGMRLRATKPVVDGTRTAKAATASRDQLLGIFAQDAAKAATPASKV